MKKFIPNLYRPFELEAVQEYLEAQAARGWILDKVGLNGFWFRKEEPRRLRYYVDIPSERRKRGGTNEYLKQYYEMCEDAGWTFVGTNTMFHIFVTEDPLVASIHTDPQVRFETTESVLKNRKGGAIVAYVFLWLVTVPMLPWIFSTGNVELYLITAALLIGLVFSGKEIYAYYQWKRQQEKAQFIGSWSGYEKHPNLVPRYVINIAFFLLAVGVSVFVLYRQIQAGMGSSWLDRVSFLWEPPLRYFVIAAAMGIGRRYFWKRGMDDDSSRSITAVLLFGLMLVLIAVASEADSCQHRKNTQPNVAAPSEKIQEPPVTAEMLGIASSYDAVCKREKGNTWVSLEYIQILDDGGSLHYFYYVYGDESLARETWESMNRRNENDISQEWVYFEKEWVDTDLSALDTESATVTWYRTTDGTTEKYIYNIQRGEVWMEIEYTEGLLTEAQLQVIGEILP